jgi:acetoin utilization protein AcuB
MDLSSHDRMPRVAALMTPFPYFLHPDDPVARALELMRAHQIRHVPVKESDHVVGIVSERDLRWMRNPALPESDPETLRIRDVYVPDPYTVELGTPLSVVLREMAARRIGAAVVVRAERLAGIVTVTDACRALGEVLEDRFGPPEPGDAA